MSAKKSGVTPSRRSARNVKKNSYIEAPILTENRMPSATRKSRRQAAPQANSSDSETPSPAVSPQTVPVSVTPKKLSKRNDGAQMLSPSSLLTELTLDPTKSRRCKFQSARKALNSGQTHDLPGREKELLELREFLESSGRDKRSGSMYISGQPGTGKTASLSSLLKDPQISNQYDKVFINCTSISTVGSIYKKISAEMQAKVAGRTEKDHLAAIVRKLDSPSDTMILIVLDEIDQLVNKKQSVLYTIFEWPSIFRSRLVLIGIANALDLTDRLLSRLNTRCELKPRLMHFAPYSKQQIVTIFQSRLEAAGVLEVFAPFTLQLLAAKVSAVSGDVRRALDIGRRVVEIAEQHKRQGCAQGSLDLCELGVASLEVDIEPVQHKEVVSVLNNVYGTSQTLNKDLEDGFPMQQKILICTLMLMLRKEKNKDITVGRLHDVYRRVCAKRNIFEFDQAEFFNMCSLIETRGMLRVQVKNEPRMSKICLQWDEEEVTAALQDKQLIAEILDDDSCLKK